MAFFISSAEGHGPDSSPLFSSSPDEKSEIYIPGFHWLHGEGEIYVIPLGSYRQEVITVVIK